MIQAKHVPDFLAYYMSAIGGTVTVQVAALEIPMIEGDPPTKNVPGVRVNQYLCDAEVQGTGILGPHLNVGTAIDCQGQLVRQCVNNIPAHKSAPQLLMPKLLIR